MKPGARPSRWARTPTRRSAAVDGEIYLEALAATLESAGDRPVLERDGHATTGAELLASIYRYAHALDGLGVGRGGLVALYGPNSPDALAVRYAAHLCGAATMYLPALPAPQQRAALVELVAPDLLVAFPETAQDTGRWVAVVVPVDEVPLTEQGKPDRAAA